MRIFKRPIRIYQSGILVDNGYCGGTLIASKFVISAAHCAYNRIACSGDKICEESYDSKITETKMVARIGEHDMSQNGEETLTPKNVRIKTIHKHPQWIEPRLPGPMVAHGYDVMILELTEALDLRLYKPACLPRSRDATTFDGKKATAVGCGVYEETYLQDKPSPIAREVMLTVIREESFKRCFPKQETINPSRGCAGLDDWKKGGCLVSFYV